MPIRAWVEVAVHVHRDLNRGVPELLLYIGKRYPATEHQTRIRVARIVDADIADLSLLKKRAPDTIPELRIVHGLGRVCRGGTPTGSARCRRGPPRHPGLNEPRAVQRSATRERRRSEAFRSSECSR